MKLNSLVLGLLVSTAVSGCTCSGDAEDEGYTVTPESENRLEQLPAQTRHAQEAEATVQLGRIASGARLYYLSERVSATGAILPTQFPGPVGATPVSIPCGQSVSTASAEWGHPVWSSLGFAIYEPHFFSYSFESYGSGAHATFTATASGDLNCDGTQDIHRINGRIREGSVRLSGVYTE